MGNVCTRFQNCNLLAEKLNIEKPALYSYIRRYNDYARRHNLEEISAFKKYTEEELDVIGKNISEYREKTKNPQFDREERKSFIETFGSPRQYALSLIQESDLTGEEISELVDEISRDFIDVVQNRALKENKSIDDLLKSGYPISSLFDEVKRDFLNSFIGAYTALKNVQNGSSKISKEEIDGYKKTARLGLKFITDNNYFFDVLSILAVSRINYALDVDINEDFSVKEFDVKTNNEAMTILDEEKPEAEHWSDALDAKPAEGSISAIIRRTLFQIPKTKMVYNTKTIIVNGRERFVDDSKREPIVGTMLRKPLYSDPSVEARKLFRLLQNCTSEAQMMSMLTNGAVNPENIRHKNTQDIQNLINESDSQYKLLASVLFNDSRLRTTFFENFNRYFQPILSVELKSTNSGTFNISTLPLNEPTKNNFIEKFIGDLKRGNINDAYSIFSTSPAKSKSGKPYNNIHVNYAKFSKALKFFKDNFDGDDNIMNRVGLTAHAAANHIALMLNMLNVENSAFVADMIYSNPEYYNKFLSALKVFFKEGNDEATGFFEPITHTPKHVDNVIKNSDKLKSAIEDIMSLVYMEDTSFVVNKEMVSFGDSQTTSRILPSAITNLIKKLKSLQKDDLVNYLNETYLDGMQFKFGNTILNRWISDMIDSSEQSIRANGFKAKFDLIRDIGIHQTTKVKAENMSDIEHTLSLMYAYFGTRNYMIHPTYVRQDGNQYYSYNPQTNQYDIKINNDELKNGLYYIVNTTRSINKGKSGIRSDFGAVSLFITGDTGQVRFFRAPHYHEGEILEGIYNLFLSDISTQDIIKQCDKDGIVIGANGKETFTRGKNKSKFGLIQFLNEDKWRKKLEEKTTPEGVINKSDFLALVKEYLDEKAEVFFETLRSDGLLEQTEDGGYVYFDSLLDKLGVSSNFAKKDGETEDERKLRLQRKEQVLKDAIKEFYYDYKFGLYTQAQLLHVSPLEFDTVEEYQKRNKVQGTNGTGLSSEAEINGVKLWGKDFSCNVCYFKDVKGTLNAEARKIFREHLIKQYKQRGMSSDKAEDATNKLLEKYDKISLTDGEAYRTLDSYRQVMASAGLNYWSYKHEEAYWRIKEITKLAKEEKRNFTSQEISEVLNLSIVLQPIKPVNDGMEKITIGGAKVINSFQFKYAEVPLIPELYPMGCKLRQMGEWMESSGIDMMCSDKCLKKGSWGELDLQYKTVDGRYVYKENPNDKEYTVIPGLDADGKIVDNPTMAQQRRYCDKYYEENKVELREEYDANTSFDEIVANQSLVINGEEKNFAKHRISMENYLIQNNITDHTDGLVIVGTQMRKLVGSLIDTERTYKVKINGKIVNISGDKLKRTYNALHTAKYMKSFEKFLDIIKDNKSLTRHLAHLISNNGRSNLALLERIITDINGDPNVPYSELSNQREMLNNIISLFKRYVIRQQISGGNIVQMSALGLGQNRSIQDPDLKPIIENGVVAGTELEMPFFFTAKDIDGHEIPLDYDTYCNEDGTFKTNDKGDILLEKEFPGILDIEIYRIPTEGGYSMAHGKIVRVCPKYSSNTIKTSPEFEQANDSDFDIDKAFFVRRTYKFKQQDADEADAWKRIYEENPDIYLRLAYVAGRLDIIPDGCKGLRIATEEDKRKLAKAYNTTVDKLHLNYYWELANIATSKSEIFKEYAKDFNTHVVEGSTFDLQSDDSKIMGLSDDAINNAIVDIQEAILSDENTMEERITPGGFPWMKLDARALRLLRHKELVPGWENRDIKTAEDVEEFRKDVEKYSKIDYKVERDYSEPQTQILFQQQNKIAGLNIGIFANSNINGAISKSLKDYRITSPENAIIFGSFVGRKATVDGVNGIHPLLGQSFKFVDVNGRNIAKARHELLGSSVDAVKDNALVDLGLNNIMADMGDTLEALGYSSFEVGLLFNQPIVKDMCLYMSRHNITNISTALKALLATEKYGGLKKNILKNDVNVNAVDIEHLVKDYIDQSSINLTTQQNVAKLINKLTLIQNKITKYIQDTRNTSANKVKVNIGGYIAEIERSSFNDDADNMITIVSNDNLDYPITDDAKSQNWATLSRKDLHAKLKEFMDKYKYHPFQYENAVSNIIRTAMSIILGEMTPFMSNRYKRMRELSRTYIAPWGLNGDVINEMNVFIPGLTVLDRNGDFNPEASTNPMGVSNKEYYLLHIIGIYSQLKKENPELFETNEFLKRIREINIDRIVEETEYGREEFVVSKYELRYSYNLDQFEKYGITMGWDELMNMGGQYAELAKMLYLHSYYLNGLNPYSNKIMEVAPTSVLESLVVDKDSDIGYLDIYENSDINDSVPDEEIYKSIMKFMIYNSNDERIVPKMPFSTRDVQSSDDYIILGSDEVKFARIAVHEEDRRLAYYRPFINVDGNLYALVDNKFSNYTIGDVINNVLSSESTSLVYKRITPVVSEDFADYALYYNSGNSYIFGDIKVASDNLFKDEEDEKQADNDNIPETGKQAADEADDKSTVMALNEDGEEVGNCKK